MPPAVGQTIDTHIGVPSRALAFRTHAAPWVRFGAWNRMGNRVFSLFPHPGVMIYGGARPAGWMYMISPCFQNGCLAGSWRPR